MTGFTRSISILRSAIDVVLAIASPNLKAVETAMYFSMVSPRLSRYQRPFRAIATRRRRSSQGRLVMAAITAGTPCGSELRGCVQGTKTRRKSGVLRSLPVRRLQILVGVATRPVISTPGPHIYDHRGRQEPWRW